MITVNIGTTVQFQFDSSYQPVAGSIASHPCVADKLQSFSVAAYQECNATETIVFAITVDSDDDRFLYFPGNTTNGTCPPGPIFTLRPSLSMPASTAPTCSGAAQPNTRSIDTASWLSSVLNPLESGASSGQPSAVATTNCSRRLTSWRLSATSPWLYSTTVATNGLITSDALISTPSQSAISAGAHNASVSANTNSAPFTSGSVATVNDPKEIPAQALFILWIIRVWLEGM